jgi:hypothetical protein
MKDVKKTHPVKTNKMIKTDRISLSFQVLANMPDLDVERWKIVSIAISAIAVFLREMVCPIGKIKMRMPNKNKRILLLTCCGIIVFLIADK